MGHLPVGREPVNEMLQLSAEPRGGYYYGWVERRGELVRVEVLPPAHLWRGEVELPGWKPDAHTWIVYMNGREFARVERHEDIAVALGVGRSATAVGRLLSRVRRSLRRR
jgi:hypothetical protein